VCDFCVKHDIEAVDLTGYFFPGYPKAPSDDYIARIKRYTHDRGITISGTGVKNDFATADKVVRAEGVALTKLWIEVAARLGAPVVRVFAGPQQKNPKDWQSAAGGASRDEVEEVDGRGAARMRRARREVRRHHRGAKSWRLPQHRTGAPQPAEARRSCLVRCARGHRQYFTADPYADIAMMVPHAVNWQIKETLGSSLKTPSTDYTKLTKIIHDGGYRGFVPIETLAMGRKDYDPAAEVVKALTAMRAAIAELK